MPLTSLRSFPLLLASATVAAGLAATHAGRCGVPGTVQVGAGSYARALPAGAAGPQATVYRTENARGPMPTNDWWSSLAWLPYSERQYPHPLAVQETAAGLRVYYPGPGITANASGVFGSMPPDRGEDLLLGHSEQAEFPDARVDGFSDWFVRARLGDDRHGMTLSYGHGSPYVYALYAGGGARLKFGKPPVVWSGTDKSPVLGITVNGRHYGLFGPTGSSWSGWGTAELTNHAPGKPYFSLAVLPDPAPGTLALFTKYAYSHVTDTRVSWSYDERTSGVTTTYAFTTTPREGKQSGTLFALYPQQWSHTHAALTPHVYASVRGPMKLAEGTTFTTQMTFPGVLPVLPLQAGEDRAALRSYLGEGMSKGPRSRDTYWEGKRLGKVATLAAIAEQAGDMAALHASTAELKERLESWFSAADAQGGVKKSGLFAYDANWGTLIGYPASFGSDTSLNDHHFHYGYFLQAAAELARRDRAWAADGRWGGMVRLLIRDIASTDRRDPLFPFLRNFDPYEGHTWASGDAKFGDGNNNESSSEAMNAWTGLILWAEATGDRSLRDLGVYLYTTEMEAIDDYWFDVHGRTRPAGFPGATVGMVWGGKAVPATWFSGEAEKIHGINWLPFHGGSLYLGRYPEYVRRNYNALVKESGGTRWGDWAGYVLMYEALTDPGDALRQFQAHPGDLPIEEGNSRANLYHWLHALDALGYVDRSVTADCPTYAVFRKGSRVTHVAYNPEAQRRIVRFSDGVTVTAEPGRFGTGP